MPMIADMKSFLVGVQVGRRIKVADAQRKIPQIPGGAPFLSESGTPIITESGLNVITEEVEPDGQ